MLSKSYKSIDTLKKFRYFVDFLLLAIEISHEASGLPPHADNVLYLFKCCALISWGPELLLSCFTPLFFPHPLIALCTGHGVFENFCLKDFILTLS